MLIAAVYSQTDNEREGIILNNQGVAQFQKGDYQEALKTLNRSAELFPTNAVIHRNLGHLYWKKLNDLARAETTFRNAIRLAPDFALTYNELGVMLMAANREKEALNVFLKAGALKPDDAIIQLNIGKVQMAVNDLRGAVATLERAKSIDPQSALIRVSLGDAYAMRKKFDLAIAEVRYAIQIDPENEEAQFLLGSLYVAKRDRQAAIVQQRAVLALNPELGRRLFQAIYSDMILVLPPSGFGPK
ncbi:MAG: tetratricopeptide repeat protein [Acidobacteriota bacterium]